MNEWILLLMLTNTSHDNGPTIIDGFQSKQLCENAATQVADGFDSFIHENRNLVVKHKCIEIRKGNEVSPRGTSSIKPSQPKEW
ncbi:hypothetical protein [Alteromonas gracilis]|uniref:hypothetical protein n=1 Tax=Alteromonas gracilis TaxID=1479524 RepID=UPI003735B7B1